MTKKGKDRKCPLCNGRGLCSGDKEEAKNLCVEHMTQAISLIFCMFAKEIVGSKRRK